MINLNEISNAIEKMPTVFDSHEFILRFLQFCPSSYGELLIAHNNVALVHAEIANFLRNNSTKLGINKTGERETTDIFGNPAECAVWTKLDVNA